MIGKLEKVDIRKVWPIEPDFTRWLEQNPELISDALDIPLVSMLREQSAGDFFVDLFGETDSGERLIVENQFGRSNHDHLGKVLTYLSAFEAKTAVWIVEDARPEHVKALAWLNDTSNCYFYLVQVQVVQIGDSLPAPQLILIVGPSAEKAKVTKIGKDLDDRERLALSFWTSLIEKLRQRGISLHSNLAPSRGDFISTGSGYSGLGFGYVIGNENARVELYIDRGSLEENRSIFNKLKQYQTEIDSQFEAGGIGALQWSPLEGKRAKRIDWRTNTGGLKKIENWDTLQEELINAMTLLAKTLNPYIEKLKNGK